MSLAILKLKIFLCNDCSYECWVCQGFSIAMKSSVTYFWNSFSVVTIVAKGGDVKVLISYLWLTVLSVLLPFTVKHCFISKVLKARKERNTVFYGWMKQNWGP